jgi:hypothetical protein
MSVAVEGRPGVIVDGVQFFGDGLCESHQFGLGLVFVHDGSPF